MLTNVRTKEIEEVFKTPIIQQTAFWSAVKKQVGLHSLAFDFKVKRSDVLDNKLSKESVVSDVLVLIQQLDNNHSVAYVPYGPELEPCEEKQGLFLEELSECMRTWLPANCILIRYDLSWESLWAKMPHFYDEDGNWSGPPVPSVQEMRLNFNTIGWNLKKATTNILPSNTIYMDLGKSEADLLESMKPKTRYNIGLSLRKGVQVRLAGVEALDVWYKLYAETAGRNNFYLHDPEYFRAVLTVKANQTQSPAEVQLLIAELDGKPLAAMFLVMTGNRGTYLYGASSSENRNIMSTYALQWKAMMIAKMRGCTDYDLFGVSPSPDPHHPMHGLYRFKTGFGGSMFHCMGCWDYPLNHDKYTCFKALELKSQGYHLA